jgi:putative addiction module killer protein
MATFPELHKCIAKDTLHVNYQIHETEQFVCWFNGLRDRQARARILVRIRRLSLGLLGDAKRLDTGVLELRVDYGPGYRIYVTRRRQAAFVLLVGGDKRTQAADIVRARQLARGFRQEEI